MFLDEFQRYLQSTFRFLESVPRLPPQQGYRVRISRPPLSRPQLPQKPQPQPPPMAQDEEEDEDCQSEQREYPAGQAKDLEKQAAQWLKQLGMADLIPKLTVTWNARLTSTAGYASYPSWRIELNPRLVDFEGQVDRTLRHELAHLVAYQRAGKRRIEPHGDEGINLFIDHHGTDFSGKCRSGATGNDDRRHHRPQFLHNGNTYKRGHIKVRAKLLKLK
jgi:hypothetical protein